MALSTGQCRTDAPPPSGIANRIYYGLAMRLAYAGMSALTEGTSARDAIAALLEAVAEGVYTTLVTDARVTIVIPADALGPGIPAVDTTITGGSVV
jgi:hypothetical protein